MVGLSRKGTSVMARLERLSVKGFTSIRSLEDFPLADSNILIGANGSGKSNFLELFKFIRAFAKLPLPNLNHADVKSYVLDAGTATDLLYKGKDSAQHIDITLHFGEFGYRFSLVPTQDDLLRIESERIQDSSDGPWRSLHSEDGFTPALLEEKEKSKTHSEEAIFESIKNWQIYHFHDTGRLSPPKRTQDVFDTSYLRFDGSNIASYLLFLRNHPNFASSYRDIVSAVRLVAPFFEDFILKPFSDDKVRLLWKQKGTDSPMKPQALSAGTLRFVCLATVLLQPKHPDTILIDEPELGLHPYAITILAELMKARSKDTQLIIATQSAELISQFEPEDVIICDRKEGQSTFSRLQTEPLSTWLSSYSLGDLWKKQVLSGGPVHE
ncbi:Predicted ATPase [Sphaerochaeta associata]|uniref:AAA family ATPase n=1 Tax=Sphaerochaeta associata TaxID=1129264 RepID=A0ABY4DCM7_9SPIR|nr:AAA family ATPase [Sphaerochaeta associata]UOM50682.1 AAA family ATPase [Sphaerochaeta associata]SMP39658.1 Predicted ATPase [Sphaerochaeta associata]